MIKYWFDKIFPKTKIRTLSWYNDTNEYITRYKAYYRDYFLTYNSLGDWTSKEIAEFEIDKYLKEGISISVIKVKFDTIKYP